MSSRSLVLCQILDKIVLFIRFLMYLSDKVLLLWYRWDLEQSTDSYHQANTSTELDTE